MSIDRNIARLTPLKEPVGDKVARPVPRTSGGRVSISGDPVVGSPVPDAGLMRSGGFASLEYGNNFGGHRQFNAEHCAEAYSAWNMGNRAGALALDLSIASNFKIVATGNLQITVSMANWPTDAYEHGANAGLDLGAMMLIDNSGGHTITVAANLWAGGAPPDMSAAGWYEIGLGVMWFPGQAKIVRAYPYIVPESA